MTHTLAVPHIIGVGIVVIVMAMLLKSRKGGPTRHRYPPLALRRRISRLVRRVLVALLWSVLTLLGGPVANKRYGVVEPILRPVEESLRAHRHRLGHAVCVPLPLRSHWFLRCRGCRAWMHCREVPALHGSGSDLQVLHGSLHSTGPCPARYLGAGIASPPLSSAPNTRMTTTR